MNTKIYWQAGLSNGETVTEGKGSFVVAAGELSPWQRLLQYCEKHELRVTSLSLCAADGRRWNLPSAGKNPRFKAFAEAPKPLGYRFFRKMGMNVIGADRDEERFASIEADYGDRKLQVWVDEVSLASWTLIV